MAFGRQVYAATAQSLAALSRDAVETLLYKHLNALPLDAGMMGFVNILTGAADDVVAPLLAELLAERNQLPNAESSSFRHRLPCSGVVRLGW